MATLSTSELMEKVKDLMDVAYQLGVSESNQMTRGRLLDILDSKWWWINEFNINKNNIIFLVLSHWNKL